ncbi:MAG TPA: hypothetical protein VMV05_11245 [bacterium]|nr:hypothetical protein [bacterium]
MSYTLNQLPEGASNKFLGLVQFMRVKFGTGVQKNLEVGGVWLKDKDGRTVNQSWATNKTIKNDWVSPLISALPERATFLLWVENISTVSMNNPQP